MSWTENKEEQKLSCEWTTDYSNNFLIYAESKTGKTFLATWKIKQILSMNAETKAYVINTDKGFALPAKQNGLEEFKDRIEYYYVNDIRTGIKVINHIRKLAKPKDVILFDLISWPWEESQKFFIDELSGNDPASFVKKAMLDTKRFQMFEGTTWSFVKKLDDLISNYLTRNPICNVIALSGLKDTHVEYAMAKKKEDIWLKIGKPQGRKDIMYEFNNIITINKDDKGTRQFMVVGSRCCDVEFKWENYTTAEDFWNKLKAKGIE